MQEKIIFFDSDGTIMDSMNLKHKECLAPALIEVFELEEIKDVILERWYKQNLYSLTRGQNRYDALLDVLEYVNANYHSVSFIENYKDWLNSVTTKSISTLEEYFEKNNVEDMRVVISWGELVDKKISEVKENIVPFTEASRVLAEVAKNFKIIIVSTANKKALEHEWGKYGFLPYVSEICSQEVGTKKYCIDAMLKKYNTRDAVMIGDSIVDYNAAHVNRIPYYPIFANHENESWVEFMNIYLPMILDGTYKDHAKELEDKFIHSLS